MRVLAVAATVTAVAAIAAAGPPAHAGLVGHGGSEAAVAGSAGSAGHDAFTISGSVGGLFPGALLRLRLAVTNREPFALVITSITITADDASTACPAANMIASSFAGQLTVAAGGSATAGVTVSLRHSAPDACQGATFPLHYAGLARKA